MSSDATDPRVTAKDRVVFSSLFVFLLVLALFWPVPVLWLNELTVGAELNITSSSFLGREAPGWDVVYWGLVGLAVLALLHGRLENVRATWSEVRPVLRRALPNLTRGLRQLGNRRTIGVALLLVAGVAALWGFLDAPLIAQVERVGSTTVHDYVRISNRLGGGGNPPMIVGFFVLAGAGSWVGIAIALRWC